MFFLIKDDEGDVRISSIIKAGVTASGAAYLALSVGLISILGYAVQEPKLGNLFSDIAPMFTFGLVCSFFAFTSAHLFAHYVSSQKEMSLPVVPLPMSARTIFWVTNFLASGSLAGLISTVIFLFQFMRSLHTP